MYFKTFSNIFCNRLQQQKTFIWFFSGCILKLFPIYFATVHKNKKRTYLLNLPHFFFKTFDAFFSKSLTLPGRRIRESADPRVQERFAATHRRDHAKNVPEQAAQLRPHANFQKVRGEQLHRKAGEAEAFIHHFRFYCTRFCGSMSSHFRYYQVGVFVVV